MSVLYIRDKTTGNFVPIKTIKGAKGDTGAVEGLEYYAASPAALGTATPGASDLVARGDHVHPMPSASDVGARPDTWMPSAEDVGARALNAAIAHEYTAILTASGWTGDAAPYTQTVDVSGILATDSPIVDLQAGDETTESYAALSTAWACVSRITTLDDQITATCYAKKPEVDIQIRMMAVR